MTCGSFSDDSKCRVLQVDTKTATISLSIANGIGCGCSGACACQNQLTPDNTFITIRRDGPKDRSSFGGCGNPAHRVFDCPVLPGQFSYPFPTFIVPCPDPVAPSIQPNWPVTYKYPPFVRYNLFSKLGSKLTFYLDHLFYDAPKGRYIADLYVNNSKCSFVRLNLNKECHITEVSSSQFNRNACVDLNPSPYCPTATCA